MIITRTPFRISLFGGGTDYPAWFKEHGGCVLGTSIDKYCYLTCRYLPPFFEHSIRVLYSITEHCNSVSDIKHPSVRGVLEHLKINQGLEIHHDGDIPARSGMASSSAFTVGLLNAMHGLKGRIRSKHELATEGIFVERDVLKENVGSQDQVLVAYGGLNKVDFFPNGEISVNPLILRPERTRELEGNLMLFYTGVKRTASDLVSSYTEDMAAKSRNLRVMKTFVDEAVKILGSETDLSSLGELMHENWLLKKELSAKISNDFVNDLYDTARKAGALGGKLTGAGGGGFLLLYVPLEQQEAVRAALNMLIHVPFKFDFGGSQVIFYSPQEEYARLSAQPRDNIKLPFRELNEGSEKL